jgi:hypothetical protein
LNNKILTIAVSLFLAAMSWAGPVIIDGTAASNNGSAAGGANQQGWLYMQRVLESLAPQVRATVQKKVVDLGTLANTEAREAISSAFALSSLPSNGWTLVHIDPSNIESFLNELNTETAGILCIPTARLTPGDLTDESLAIINAAAIRIGAYVAEGGGLFAMGENPSDVPAYGWLTSLIPTISAQTVPVPGASAAVSLTKAANTTFPDLKDADLDFGSWRSYFSGVLGRLSILGVSDWAGDVRSVMIGGGTGADFETVPVYDTCYPTTLPASQTGCVTRSSLFWMTHPDASTNTCVSLLRALQANSNEVCLGFLKLPVEFENADNVKDAYDAVMEAAGIYRLVSGYTGEERGKQTLKLPGSALCKARKKLAVELIAAIANNVLLGTSPANCAGLPSDLIDQAGAVASGYDVTAIKQMTKLLKQFNMSGMANPLPFDLEECSGITKAQLKEIARDPTTKFSCPGPNAQCETAQVIFFPDDGDIFDRGSFASKVNLSKFDNFFGSTECDTVGAYAIWKILPEVAKKSRQFTASTYDSNFDTIMGVFKGTCSAPEQVTCNDDSTNHPPQSLVRFLTDGTNTYYIVVGGKLDGVGSIKLKVTSP